MRHPEAQNNVGWVPVAFQQQNSYRAAFPWWKVAFFCSGVALLTFAAGYFFASQTAANQVTEANQKSTAAIAEAARVKASAAGDLEAAQSKVREQQQRLRLVNDCVYSALNAPLPTPLPTP